MHWVRIYLRDNLHISIGLFSLVVRTMAVKVKHTCALIESVYICSSLSAEAACLIVQHKSQFMYTFYCFGNMLSLSAEFFFVFFMLRENVMNCFAPNLLPPKHHMKFFCRQNEFSMAPCLTDLWNFHMFFL